MTLVYQRILHAVYLYVLFPTATSLRCYFCADNGLHDKCGNYSIYLEARWTGPQSPFLRNCSSENNNICYIETYKSAAGTIVSEIRDCSDDSSFSFSSSEHQEKYRKLRELSVSNKTRCVYDGQNLLCLSKCVTDFCNGPQIDNNLISASCCGSQKYSLLILIVLILSYFSL